VDKRETGDFTRNRKLPLPKLIVLLLYLVAGGSGHDGVDIKLGEFFSISRRAGLWADAQAPHRSALSKARKKVCWETFEALLGKVVSLAYAVFPPRDEYVWCGLSVYAFDGSKYNLPATDALRREFDPDSGLDKPGKGHYPQMLVNTVYDVFRRMPIGRDVSAIPAGDERKQALKLLDHLPSACVCLFDRGYPSYAFINTLLQQPRQFLMRCPAKSTFPAVMAFVHSRLPEGVVWLTPSDTFKRRLTKQERKALKPIKPIKLRIIRLEHPDGTVSVLLSNLYDGKKFPCHAVIGLYYRRWAVENHYRDEKVSLEVEHFHSRTPDGIRQELFAILIVCVMARTLTALAVDSESIETAHCKKHPQLKNATKAFAREAALLVAANPEKAWTAFQELLAEIQRVKYYQPKVRKPPQPRINKGAANKWQVNRRKKMHVVA
jgi:hypothetical protein